MHAVRIPHVSCRPEQGAVWPCRERPRRQVHVKFNNWELEGAAGAWHDLQHSGAPHEQGADWWCD